MPYKVTIDPTESLQVPEAINSKPLVDMNGNEVGYDQIMRTYYNGEVIEDNKVSPSLREILENADESNPAYRHLKGKLEKVGDDPSLNLAQRLGLPFEGYSDMSEEDIVAALHFLPGETVQVVKEYESTLGEGREKILRFNAGTRDNNFERLEGDVVRSGDRQDLTPKAAGLAVTREVGPDTVVEGEGYTGSDPDRSRELASKDVEGTENPRPARRARARSGQAAPAAVESDGSGS